MGWPGLLAVAVVLCLAGATVLPPHHRARTSEPTGRAGVSAQGLTRMLSQSGQSGQSGAQEHSRISTDSRLFHTDSRRLSIRKHRTVKSSASQPKPSPTPTAPAAASGLSPSTRVSSARSGLTWASGVYIPGSNPSNTAAFGAWRGRKVDVVTDWPARQTWNDIIDPSWLYEDWANTPYTKVFGVAPIPEGGGSTLAACAAGDYDSNWVQFGRNIAAAGLAGQTIIRLGWEFNGNWYQWTASDPAAFAGCWRQIYTSAESTAPALRWDWDVNRGVGAGLADARQAYPGDAYVDIVGVDSYDQYPGATGAAGWNQQYAGAYGLKFWADFAAAHHKRLSVPEWGLYPSRGANGGGDDAYYIARMEAFFAGLGDRLAYESYFDESAAYYGGSIFGPDENPVAAAEYRAIMSGPSG